MSNPWNLTTREEQALRLLIEHGMQKIVALEMGVHKAQVSRHLSNAAEKMNERAHLHAVLAFDRWERGQQS